MVSPLVFLLFLIDFLPTNGQEDILVSTLAGSLSGWFGSGYVDDYGTNAQFTGPFGVAISPDRSYSLVADEWNHVIRHIILSTAYVSTFAGSLNGSSGHVNGYGTNVLLYRPSGLTISSDGSYSLVVGGNNAIRQIIISTAHVSTLAGSLNGSSGYVNGYGTNALFHFPLDVTISPNGLYALISDYQTIRKFILSTACVTTLAGSLSGGYLDGDGTSALFYYLIGVIISSDGSYSLVSDEANYVIRKIIISTAKVTTFAGSLSGSSGHMDGYGTNAKFNGPFGMVISPDGSYVLVADTWNNAIRKIVLSTVQVTTLVGTLSAWYNASGYVNGYGTNALFRHPRGVAISSDGSLSLIGDTDNNAIRELFMYSPTVFPSSSPSFRPSSFPSSSPSFSPTIAPSLSPTVSFAPTTLPSSSPTSQPTQSPEFYGFNFDYSPVIIIPPILLVVLVGIYLSGVGLSLLFALFFPTLDLISDLMYFSMNDFYSLGFLIAVPFFIFVVPVVYLVHRIISERVFIPSIVDWLRVCWIIRLRGYDLYLKEERVLGSETSNAPWLLLFPLILMISLLSQVFVFVLGLILYPVIVMIWFSIGIILVQTKMLSISYFETRWINAFKHLISESSRSLPSYSSPPNQNQTQIDSANDHNSVSANVDPVSAVLLYQFHMLIVLELIFETIPQIVIQSMNNHSLYLDLKRWSGVSIFSLICSGLMLLNGVCHYGYWVLWRGERKTLADIPLSSITFQIIPKRAVKDSSRDIAVELNNVQG